MEYLSFLELNFLIPVPGTSIKMLLNCSDENVYLQVIRKTKNNKNKKENKKGGKEANERSHITCQYERIKFISTT